MKPKVCEGGEAFFGCGRSLNLRPCVYYALFLRIELSSRGHGGEALIRRVIYMCIFFLSKLNMCSFY